MINKGLSTALYILLIFINAVIILTLLKTSQYPFGSTPYTTTIWVIIALIFTSGYISGCIFSSFRPKTNNTDDSLLNLSETPANLSISTDRYSAIIQNAVDGIITINSAGIVTFFSQSAESIFGYASDEIVGKNINLLMCPDHRQNHDSYLAHYQYTSNAGIIGNGPRELKALRKDHSMVDVEISINKVSGIGGQEYIGIIRDITERKHAEKLIMMSKNRFRNAIEQFPYSIQIFDSDGYLTNVNGAWRQLWGDDNSRVGKYNILRDENFKRKGLTQYIEKAFNGDSVTIPATQFDLVNSAGSNRWIQSHIFPVFNNAGDIVDIVLISEDTTEQIQAEEDRMKLNRHIRMILESVDEGVFGVNLGGACTFINDSAVDLLGYSSSDQILGKNILSIVCMENTRCETAPPVSNPIFRTYTEGESSRHEDEVFWKKDNTCFPVSFSTRPILDNRLVTGAVVSFSDITERKNSENILRENEEKYRQLFSAVSDAILILDAESQRIIEANQAAHDLYGYDKTTIVTLRYSDISEEHLFSKDISDSSSVNIINHSEMNHKKKSGGLFPVEVSFGTFDLHKRKMICAAVRDITDRKSNEHKLKEARDSAIKAYNVKSQFLANISHEIRTPMNGLLGTLQLLSETELSNEQSEHLRTSLECGHNLMGLLDDILCFTKSESERLTLESVPFSIRELFNDTIATHTASARKKNIYIDLQLSDELPETVIGDPTRIRQVINNLISNALKFTRHGSITIKLSTIKRDKGIARLHFEIVDTGIGIKKEYHKRIFETFSQADGSTTRMYGGTGLGLAICKQLINRMGGRIGLISGQSKGSTFWFDLDFRIPRSHTRAQPANFDHINIDVNRELNILVAEDNPINQKVSKSILQQIGCNVTIVNNGEEAVRAAIHEKFDVILMDCQMPKMDGYEATGTIRNVDNYNMSTPIIAVTANAMPGDEIKCIASGMNDYISKPVNKEVLVMKLNTWATPGASRIIKETSD